MRKSALIAFLSVTFHSVAQVTVTDNFNTAVNWTPSTNFGTSNLVISGGQVNYLTQGAPDNASFILFTGGTLPYTSNWEAQVDVHARAASSVSLFDYFYGSLKVVRTGDPLFQFNSADQPLYTSAAADIMRPGGSTNGFQLTYTLAGIGEVELPGGAGIQNPTTDGSLRLAFDATTKTITGFFDADAAIGGYTWTPIATIDVDGAQNFGMTNASTFTLALTVASGADVFTSGHVFFDNLSITTFPSTQPTGVPDGGSSIAMFGISIALITTQWRLKRRRK